MSFSYVKVSFFYSSLTYRFYTLFRNHLLYSNFSACMYTSITQVENYTVNCFVCYTDYIISAYRPM
jgi:hypothetical protein